MRIELTTPEENQILLDIQKNHPILTYQNKGYDTIDTSKMTDEDKEAFKKVQDILLMKIKGFSSFQNFRINKKNEIELRFQYNYSYDGSGIPFTGVGYLTVRELHKGFDK